MHLSWNYINIIIVLSNYLSSWKEGSGIILRFVLLLIAIFLIWVIFFIMSASYDLFFISEIKMRFFFFGKLILAKILITPVKCHCSIFCGTISSLNVDVYADIVSTR